MGVRERVPLHRGVRRAAQDHPAGVRGAAARVPAGAAPAPQAGARHPHAGAAEAAPAAGAQVLDGLGAIGDGAHATHEWVDITTLEDRSKLLHALIKDLLNE